MWGSRGSATTSMLLHAPITAREEGVQGSLGAAAAMELRLVEEEGWDRRHEGMSGASAAERLGWERPVGGGRLDDSVFAVSVMQAHLPSSYAYTAQVCRNAMAYLDRVTRAASGTDWQLLLRGSRRI